MCPSDVPDVHPSPWLTAGPPDIEGTSPCQRGRETGVSLLPLTGREAETLTRESHAHSPRGESPPRSSLFPTGILPSLVPHDKRQSHPVLGRKDAGVPSVLPAQGSDEQRRVSSHHLQTGMGFKASSWRFCGDRPCCPRSAVGVGPLPALTSDLPSAAVSDRCLGSPRQMVTKTGRLAGPTACRPPPHTDVCTDTHQSAPLS